MGDAVADPTPLEAPSGAVEPIGTGAVPLAAPLLVLLAMELVTVTAAPAAEPADFSRNPSAAVVAPRTGGVGASVSPEALAEATVEVSPAPSVACLRVRDFGGLLAAPLELGVAVSPAAAPLVASMCNTRFGPWPPLAVPPLAALLLPPGVAIV